jgi:hypothetical protein
VKILLLPTLIIYFFTLAGCGSSSSTDDNSSTDIDRSTLPDVAPSFAISPMQFPSGVNSDLYNFGVYNISSNCDVVHYGWDFVPSWNSYPDNKVPIIAVANGIISNIILRATNEYQGQQHNIYTVFLAVAKEVDVQYTFEPFITFGETDATQWINVSKGNTVSAGDVIGYLPKVAGNLGDTLIHIDWKIGTGTNRDNYVCPTTYFAGSWQATNIPLLEEKIQSQCTQACYE